MPRENRYNNDFRVKIISPIKIDEADLRRRQIRYTEHAGRDTRIQVFNLEEGPTTLDTPGDLLFCEHAVFLEGMQTNPDDFEAILIDCEFDPALEALREQAPIATFGPMLTTLLLVGIVASRFSYIARAERQTQWLAEIAEKYGFGDQLASSRALGISYQESRKPKVFDDAMSRQLERPLNDLEAGMTVHLARPSCLTSSADWPPWCFRPNRSGSWRKCCQSCKTRKTLNPWAASFARTAPIRRVSVELFSQEIGKWARMDSNHRPHGCEPCALTN